ncbi:MAG: hypothetical protein HYY28_15380 [Betaproteobacteria bacterium]|nr:hypothetical protein [Betaproteobacteria bacterium]
MASRNRDDSKGNAPGASRSGIQRGQAMSIFFSSASRTSVPVFHLLRFFSVTGFVGIVVTAILLALFCRQLVIPQNIRSSETTSQALAHTLLTSLRPELHDYLASVQSVDPQGSVDQALSARLLDLFEQITRQTSVVRIKLYNRNGIVVFSTERGQIGDNQANNTGFVLAGNGRIASDLIYRGTVNRFDGETEDENLMHTYVPVQASPTGPVHGVFEIYTDMNNLVSDNRRIAFTILAGAGLILMSYFGLLIWAAWRASKIVGRQQHAIRERTSSLEMFAAETLGSEELAKRELAAKLHEDLAQTLSAIKVNVENSFAKIGVGDASRESLASAVAALQAAIKQVETLAMELRPSVLDEFGLLPTIRWFCRQFERGHPAIRIEDDISVPENYAFGPLAIVIYRIIESSFRNIARFRNTDRICLSLQLADRAILLAIDDTSRDATYAAAARSDSDLNARFAGARERTTLSGGTFSVTHNPAGGITLHARWPS